MGWIGVVLNDSSGNGDCAAAGQAAGSHLCRGRAGGEGQSCPRWRADPQLHEGAVKDGCEILVAGGGDGTINTAASVLVDRDIPLGVLPARHPQPFRQGSGNPARAGGCRPGRTRGNAVPGGSGRGERASLRQQLEPGGVSGHCPSARTLSGDGRGKWVAALWASLVVLRRNPFMGVRIIVEGQSTVRRTPFVFIGNNEYRMAGLHAGSRETLVGKHMAVTCSTPTGGSDCCGWRGKCFERGWMRSKSWIC